MLLLINNDKQKVIGLIERKLWNIASYEACTKIVRTQSGVIYRVDDIHYINKHNELGIKDFHQNLVCYKATKYIIEKILEYKEKRG